VLQGDQLQVLAYESRPLRAIGGVATRRRKKAIKVVTLTKICRSTNSLNWNAQEVVRSMEADEVTEAREGKVRISSKRGQSEEEAAAIAAQVVEIQGLPG